MSTPNIIGLAGAARAGKDTVGGMLKVHTAYDVDRFAGPIYKAIHAITGLDYDDIQEHKDQKHPIFECTPRKMLQTLGTDWGRDIINENIWVMSMEARHKAQFDFDATFGLVIPDVRFRNEVNWIRAQGGVTVYVIRPSQEAIAETAHASENGVTADDCDITFLNDTTLPGLHQRIKALLEGCIAVRSVLDRRLEDGEGS